MNYEHLRDKYDDHYSGVLEIKNNIEKLCYFLEGVTKVETVEDGLEDFNPFNLNFGETVDILDFNEDFVGVSLVYRDSYDDWDSHTFMKVPNNIVDMWMEGDKKGVITEVIRLTKENKQFTVDRDLKCLRNQAEVLGYRLVK